jgi:hypothetical protein
LLKKEKMSRYRGDLFKVGLYPVKTCVAQRGTGVKHVAA